MNSHSAGMGGVCCNLWSMHMQLAIFYAEKLSMCM